MAIGPPQKTPDGTQPTDIPRHAAEEQILAERAHYMLLARILVYCSFLAGMLLKSLPMSHGGVAGLIAGILLYMAFIVGCGFYARAKGYSWTVGLLGTLVCLGFLVIFCLPDKLAKLEKKHKDKKTLSPTLGDEMARDICDGLSRGQLLRKYELSEHTLSEYCRKLTFDRKIRESDYLRIVGEPFVA